MEAHYTQHKWYTYVRRHFIILLAKIMKFLFTFLLSIFLVWILHYFSESFQDFVFAKYALFLSAFFVLNYAFINLALALITYSYDLVIIFKDQIVNIKCSLLFRDDIEIIDAYRVMKVDGYSRGFFANVLWYGNIIIEQQKDDVRVFHFIPHPHKILMIIKRQRESVLEERKKKYFISETENNLDI